LIAQADSLAASSRGRGNRAAGWFSDYITGQGDTDMASLVLFEGIKGWVNAGADYIRLMDEYNEEVWANN
jgi:arsenical-resistance protein 2